MRLKKIMQEYQDPEESLKDYWIDIVRNKIENLSEGEILVVELILPKQYETGGDNNE